MIRFCKKLETVLTIDGAFLLIVSCKEYLFTSRFSVIRNFMHQYAQHKWLISRLVTQFVPSFCYWYKCSLQYYAYVCIMYCFPIIVSITCTFSLCSLSVFTAITFSGHYLSLILYHLLVSLCGLASDPLQLNVLTFSCCNFCHLI